MHLKKVQPHKKASQWEAALLVFRYFLARPDASLAAQLCRRQVMRDKREAAKGSERKTLTWTLQLLKSVHGGKHFKPFS